LWPSAEGKVIASRVQSRRKGPDSLGYDSSDTEMTHAPLVEYEYQVAGTTYRSSRYTIGHGTSEYELESILERHPVGAKVTVYYDPADPQTAVLEREFPKKIWLVAFGCLAFAIGGPLLAVLGYFYGVDWLKANSRAPGNAPFVAALTGFALLTLLFAVGLTAAVVQAYRWPTVRGRIVSSGAETFRQRPTAAGEGYRRHHKAAVVYTYEVNGRQYTGDRVTLFLKVSATTSGPARRTASRYPVGSEVNVRYNPKKPSEACLRPFSLAHLIPWIVAGAMLSFAWSIAFGA
jgi:hypothetical protein